jgi:hypothetical protein
MNVPLSKGNYFRSLKTDGRLKPLEKLMALRFLQGDRGLRCTKRRPLHGQIIDPSLNRMVQSPRHFEDVTRESLFVNRQRTSRYQSAISFDLTKLEDKS